MNHLAVFLYNEHVGNITYLGQDRTLFSFTESYIEDAQRPILSLRFKEMHVSKRLKHLMTSNEIV